MLDLETRTSEKAAKRLALIQLKRRLVNQEQITLAGVLFIIDKLIESYR